MTACDAKPSWPVAAARGGVMTTQQLHLFKEGQGDKRPSEFKTAAGDGFALITLERVKKAK
jgi:hypothetical protein